MFLREASTRVSFRLNPWQGLPGVACSKHAPAGGCPVSHMSIFFEALFDAPLRNDDVEFVCEYPISKETIVRHEHDGGEAPFRLDLLWIIVIDTPHPLLSAMTTSKRVSMVRMTHSTPSSLASQRSSSPRFWAVRALSKPKTWLVSCGSTRPSVRRQAMPTTDPSARLRLPCSSAPGSGDSTVP